MAGLRSIGDQRTGSFCHCSPARVRFQKSKSQLSSLRGRHEQRRPLSLSLAYGGLCERVRPSWEGSRVLAEPPAWPCAASAERGRRERVERGRRERVGLGLRRRLSSIRRRLSSILPVLLPTAALRLPRKSRRAAEVRGQLQCTCTRTAVPTSQQGSVDIAALSDVDV